MSLNKQLSYVLEVYHIPSKQVVKFPAFIEDFSDTYTQNWNSENTFGRNDPHMTFQGTGRVIKVSFKVPAESIGESIENQRKMSLLAQMQYPSYKSAGNNALSIQGSPIFKVKFANWITDGSKLFSSNASAEAAGLVCVMAGISFSPNMDVGVMFNTIEDNAGDVVFGQGAFGDIYPKEFTLTMELTVLHSHKLGWVQGKKGLKFRSDKQESFPYGISGVREETIVLNAGELTRQPSAQIDPYEGTTNGEELNQDINTVKTSYMLEGD